MFNQVTLFGMALGIEEPIYIEKIDFDKNLGELHIHMDFRKGGRFACSECGKTNLPIHDTEALEIRDTLLRRPLMHLIHHTLHQRLHQTILSVHGIIRMDSQCLQQTAQTTTGQGSFRKSLSRSSSTMPRERNGGFLAYNKHK
jgi:hypothetical protein